MKEFEYLAPTTIKEVVDLLLKYKNKACILNGGTDVVIRLRERLISPEYIIDIKHIKELKGINLNIKEKYLFIGALSTMNEISANEYVKKYYPYYAEACHSVGSNQVRNRATSVGNIVNASPLADSATPLYALDATLIIEGQNGRREVPIREFITFVRKTVLQEGEIVIGIKIPLYENTKGVFSKNARRREVDLSNVCATIVKIGNEYKIAFGAVAPTPIRLTKTEEFLKNKEISDKTIEEAKELAIKEVSPIDDIRASKEYRLDIVKVIIDRSLRELNQGGE
ncbi:MAG: xanthine dehydrogenase family protein subunit M [Eubacteriales bacterium]|nr:xanthine dehydrogenase family protein subunit M [Eubacteriales bacterium]